MHAPRTKFDTLFSEPRHYRADLRLLFTAIRHRWLNDASQAERETLAARFEQAIAERPADDPATMLFRALLAEYYVRIELERADQSPLLRALW